MNEVPEHRIAGCTREDCPISQDGICVEDHEHPEECPNVILGEPKPVASRDEYRKVDLSGALSLEAVATMLQDRRIPTASLIGAGTCGKTTFLAVLFYQFLKSHLGFVGHKFMDSDSFLALNEKLHYADIKSNSPSVNMPRTSLEEEIAFHFKTKNKKDEIHECIFVDIPGEFMEQRLSKGTAGWSQFRGLARSTHVVLFLDLDVIANRRKRGAHVEQAVDALVHSIQSNTWRGRNLMIVFSKADAHRNKLDEEISSIQERLSTRLADDFRTIEFCELHSLGGISQSAKSIGTVWNWLHSQA